MLILSSPSRLLLISRILAPASTKRKGHYRSSRRSGPRSATPLFAAPLRRGRVFNGPINSDRLGRRWVQTNDDALYDQRRPYEVLPQGDEGTRRCLECGDQRVDVHKRGRSRERDVRALSDDASERGAARDAARDGPRWDWGASVGFRSQRDAAGLRAVLAR